MPFIGRIFLDTLLIIIGTPGVLSGGIYGGIPQQVLLSLLKKLTLCLKVKFPFVLVQTAPFTMNSEAIVIIHLILLKFLLKAMLKRTFFMFGIKSGFIMFIGKELNL